MTGRKLGLRKRIGLRLFSDLYAEKIAEHKLRTLFWECTLRCNLAFRSWGRDRWGGADTAAATVGSIPACRICRWRIS